MALPPRATKFRQDRAIVDPRTGNPTTEFLRSINSSFELLNYVASVDNSAVDAALTADTALAAANTAQDDVNDADTRLDAIEAVVGPQQPAVADAVPAAAAPTQVEFNALVTQFNLLLSRLRAHGLIAP